MARIAGFKGLQSFFKNLLGIKKGFLKSSSFCLKVLRIGRKFTKKKWVKNLRRLEE